MSLSFFNRLIAYCGLLTLLFFTSCDYFKKTNKSDLVHKKDITNIELPFVEHPGYIKGGKQFAYSFVNEKGKEISILDLNDNVVIIVFSTTWCHNCPSVLKDMDDLSAILAKDKLDNVKIIALNVGNESIQLIKEHYNSIKVKSLDVYKSIPIHTIEEFQGVPVCLVFDKEGAPVWGYIGGGVTYKSEEFINFIKVLAKK